MMFTLFPDTDPHLKDDCGVFGVIRKKNAPQIPSSVAIRAIECVRFRGSPFGAGFAGAAAGACAGACGGGGAGSCSSGLIYKPLSRKP